MKNGKSRRRFIQNMSGFGLLGACWSWNDIWLKLSKIGTS